jgi:hypothetical protein
MQNYLLYFRSRLLGTFGDDLLCSFQYYLEALKLHMFRKKNIRYSWRCYNSAFAPVNLTEFKLA